MYRLCKRKMLIYFVSILVAVLMFSSCGRTSDSTPNSSMAADEKTEEPYGATIIDYETNIDGLHIFDVTTDQPLNKAEFQLDVLMVSDGYPVYCYGDGFAVYDGEKALTLHLESPDVIHMFVDVERFFHISFVENRGYAVKQFRFRYSDFEKSGEYTIHNIFQDLKTHQEYGTLDIRIQVELPDEDELQRKEAMDLSLYSAYLHRDEFIRFLKAHLDQGDAEYKVSEFSADCIPEGAEHVRIEVSGEVIYLDYQRAGCRTLIGYGLDGKVEKSVRVNDEDYYYYMDSDHPEPVYEPLSDAIR